MTEWPLPVTSSPPLFNSSLIVKSLFQVRVKLDSISTIGELLSEQFLKCKKIGFWKIGEEKNEIEIENL